MPLSSQFFIAAAMAVVATAIGTGLYLQLGIEFAASLLVAVASYTAMLAVHLLVRRRHTLVGLRSEIDRIETEIAGLRADRISSAPDPRHEKIREPEARPAARGQTRVIAGAGAYASATETPIQAAFETTAAVDAVPGKPLREPSAEWPAQPAWTFRPGYARPPHEDLAVDKRRVIAEGVELGAGQTADAHSASMLPAPELAPAILSSAGTGSSSHAARSAEERDAIQQLIRRLAVDLNTGRAELEEAASQFHQAEPAATLTVPASTVPSSDGDTVADSDIARSVAALRSVATTMRDASTRAAPEAALQGRDAAAGPPQPPQDTSPRRNTPTVPPPTPATGRHPQGAETNIPSAFRPSADTTSAPMSPAAAKPAATQVPDLLDAIASAVETGRMNVFVEPIIGLADRKARHFEVFVRLRNADGMPIVDTDYRMAAEGTGLLPRIDAAKMQHSAVVAGRLHEKGRRGTVHSAISGEALTDGFFVEDLTTTVATNEGIGSHLVLTFAQSDVRCFRDVHWDTLAVMREFGMTFALEAVTAMDMDFDVLARRGFTFVKLDASVFLEGMPTEGGLVPAADLCRYLAGLGLGLIIGHIDDERSLARVLGFGALLGQGTLFGAPRPLDLHLQARSAA